MTIQGDPGSHASELSYDIVVAGGGPVGLAAANLLGRLGLKVACIAPEAGRRPVSAPDTPLDTRTAALFPASLALLHRAGAGFEREGFEGTQSEQRCAPLRGIRIIDATGRMLRAPDVLFDAAELGLESFGANIANADIVAALLEACRACAAIDLWPDCKVSSLELGETGCKVTLNSGQDLRCAALVGADGRNSLARRSAGLAAQTWSYDQVALATAFRHARPHDGISNEFHTCEGPCTTVPLALDSALGRLCAAEELPFASSLVWMMTPHRASELMQCDVAAFATALTRQTGGILGTMGGFAPRRTFPLAGLVTPVAAGRRAYLVGEAAHVFPPIGAQGLNLGLRDVGDLVDTLEDAIQSGADLGGPDVTASFVRRRRADIVMRTYGIDLMNRSLRSESLPLQILRSTGLLALRGVSPLRRAVMRQGLVSIGDLPRTMRPLDHPEKTGVAAGIQ